MEIAYIVEVASSDISNPRLLPLADSFDFDFFLLILSDVISNNIPVLIL